MAELRVRKRHRLREKEIRALAEEISSEAGVAVFSPNDTVDRAETGNFDVVFVNGATLAIVQEGRAFLTVRGLLKYKPSKAFVTVDMGAVPFVSKGADVMAPGIVEADPGIREGDFVWIRDANHKVPLAIGKALMSGEEMLKRNPGKAIKSIHYVGDKIWKIDEV